MGSEMCIRDRVCIARCRQALHMALHSNSHVGKPYMWVVAETARSCPLEEQCRCHVAPPQIVWHTAVPGMLPAHTILLHIITSMLLHVHLYGLLQLPPLRCPVPEVGKPHQWHCMPMHLQADLTCSTLTAWGEVDKPYLWGDLAIIARKRCCCFITRSFHSCLKSCAASL